MAFGRRNRPESELDGVQIIEIAEEKRRKPKKEKPPKKVNIIEDEPIIEPEEEPVPELDIDIEEDEPVIEPEPEEKPEPELDIIEDEPVIEPELDIDIEEDEPVIEPESEEEPEPELDLDIEEDEQVIEPEPEPEDEPEPELDIDIDIEEDEPVIEPEPEEEPVPELDIDIEEDESVIEPEPEEKPEPELDIDIEEDEPVIEPEPEEEPEPELGIIEDEPVIEPEPEEEPKPELDIDEDEQVIEPEPEEEPVPELDIDIEEDEPVIEPEEEPELDIIEDEPVIEPESEEEPEPELGIDEDEPVIEPEPEEEPEPELDIEEDEPVIELGSEVEPEPELTDEERSELFKGFEDVSETVEIADTEPEPALESEGTTVMLDDPIADVDSTASESEGSAETEPIMIDIPVPAEKKSSKKKKKADRVSDGTLLIDMDDENVSALMGVRKKKKKKLVTGSRGIVGIPTKVLVIMAAVLMLMVIGGSVWLFLRLSGWAEDRQRAINADRIMLDNTETKSNSLNIIYCDALLPLGDDSLHITKTSFDGQSSMFYLAERPDFTRYGFEIVDNFGSRHSLDPAFIYEDGTVDFSDKTLRFEPLTAGAASFTMYVTDMDSGAVYEHEFGFETPHGLIFEKRYDHVSTIRDAEDRVVGIINGMRFASTGTALYFTLEEQEMNPHYMPEAGGSSVSLTDSGVSIGPLRQEDVNYGAVGGGTMYRMDFRPINYLTGSVRFTFSRLMLNLPLGVTADARPLLRNLNPELYAVYEAGEYAVVLERVLTYTDGSYQLVFHAEDTTAVVEGPGDRSNRREVLLDCEAVITLHSGEQVSLPGVDGQSKAEGSNVFFKVQDSPYAQEIAAGQIRSFEINIKSVLVRVPDIAYEVDLDSAFVTGQAFPDTLRAQLIATNTEKEDYSVSVVAYEEMGDNHRAVVRELWKDESGEYRVTTREVAGFIDPYGLILNTDNIISEIVGLK